MVAKAKDDKNALDFVINQWGSQEVAIRCTAGKLGCVKFGRKGRSPFSKAVTMKRFIILEPRTSCEQLSSVVESLATAYSTDQIHAPEFHRKQ